MLPREFDVCAVQLPGRSNRFREPPLRRLADLIPAALEGLRPYLERPFAFFGHSMGALVAFELTRELRRQGAPLPVALFASAHEAPHRPPPLPPVTHLSDREFVEEVGRRFGGIPAEVLAEPELLDLVVPVLRADIGVLEGYRYLAEEPLDCAISSFGGALDSHLTREDAEAWREHTRGAFRLRILPGGHFFLDGCRQALLASIAEDLQPWLPRG